MSSIKMEISKALFNHKRVSILSVVNSTSKMVKEIAEELNEKVTRLTRRIIVKKSIIFCCLLAFIAIYFLGKNKIFNETSEVNNLINTNKGLTAETSNQTKEKKDYNTINLIDPKGDNIPVFISFLPTYEEYLLVQADPKVEIERTSVTFLDLKSTDGSFYNLLNYSCGNKLCSTLLVKLSKENNVISSLESGYGIFIDFKQSPHLENAVFRYAVNEGNLVNRNNLVPINIKDMLMLQPENKQIFQEYIENAHIPITNYKWLNNDVVSMDVADLQNSAYGSLLNWYSNPAKKSKEIKIEFY